MTYKFVEWDVNLLELKVYHLTGMPLTVLYLCDALVFTAVSLTVAYIQ